MRDVLLAGFLGINAGQQKPRFLWELDPAELENMPIAVAGHCFGRHRGCWVFVPRSADMISEFNGFVSRDCSAGQCLPKRGGCVWRRKPDEADR